MRVIELGREYLREGGLSEKEVAKKLKERNGEALAAFVRRAGLGSEKHLKYTVLKVAEYPEAEREALQKGASFAQVERLRRLVKQGKLSRERLEQAVQEGTWDRLLSQRRARPDWAKRPVWIFPANDRARQSEALNSTIAELLVELYSQPGELVVDPMAGRGTIAQAAERLGRKSWASDITGDGQRVKKLDIKDLKTALGEGKADLLVLHPPTFRWYVKHEYSRQPRWGRGNTYDDYTNWLSGLVEEALPVIKTRGRILLITQPEHLPFRNWSSKPKDEKPRWPFLAPLENVLAEHELQPVAYHLAVSDDGEEDWSIFVGKKLFID